ncbi:MAG: vacuolar protein-sorting-associated protein 25 [Candidatus Heimdallarchaeota archaeon]|nr:vacuolar protein-sorting-associated protein 25 [Candidatus Heimdallarchaeota archaeon]
MSVKQKKKKTKAKTKEKTTQKEQIIQEEQPSQQQELQEERTQPAKSTLESKPPREATVTISLIENPVTTEDKIYNALLRIEQLIQSDVAISREDLFDLGEDVERQLLEILPEWINKPWMYVTPEHQKQLDSWCADWSNFIMEYARINIKHIIHIEEERAKYPFNNKQIKKRLDRKQFQTIGDYIVAQEMGIWWDKKKIRLRLYWRTLDEWADIIYEWSLKTGRAAGPERVMTMLDIQEAGQPWSTIPVEDLKRIFEIMKEKGYIEWADKKKTAIAFII